MKKDVTSRAEAHGGWFYTCLIALGLFDIVALVATGYVWAGILFPQNAQPTPANPATITADGGMGSAKPSASPTPHHTQDRPHKRQSVPPSPSASASPSPSTPVLVAETHKSPDPKPATTTEPPATTEPTTPSGDDGQQPGGWIDEDPNGEPTDVSTPDTKVDPPDRATSQ